MSDPEEPKDEDELAGDPEAEAIKPLHSKRTLVAATVAGVVFGLILAGVMWFLEQHHPRFRRAAEDAGPPGVPETALEDAGAEPESSPWLEE